MAGWHHWLDGRESQWTLGVGDGQGSLECCDSWGCKESDTTEQLNWTQLKFVVICYNRCKWCIWLDSSLFLYQPLFWVLPCPWSPPLYINLSCSNCLPWELQALATDMNKTASRRPFGSYNCIWQNPFNEFYLVCLGVLILWTNVMTTWTPFHKVHGILY